MAMANGSAMPPAEAGRVRDDVAVHDLGRERPARAIQPAHAEQAQDRALLARPW